MEMITRRVDTRSLSGSALDACWVIARRLKWEPKFEMMTQELSITYPIEDAPLVAFIFNAFM